MGSVCSNVDFIIPIPILKNKTFSIMTEIQTKKQGSAPGLLQKYSVFLFSYMIFFFEKTNVSYRQYI